MMLRLTRLVLKKGLLGFCIAVLAFGCRSSLTKVQPSQDSEPLVTKATRITIPVIVKLESLRKAAEKHIPHTLSEDVQGARLGIEADGRIKLKRGPISITGADDVLTFGASLAGNFRGTAKLGPVELAPVGLQLELRLISNVSLTTNFQLQVESTPRCEVADIQPRGRSMAKVPLLGNWVRRNVADELVLPRIRDWARDLDAQIADEPWLMEAVTQRLQQFADGVKIAAGPDVWLQVRPIVMRVSRIQCGTDKLVCHLGIDATVTASLTKPVHSVPVGRVPVISDEAPSSEVAVNLLLHAGFPEWSALVRPFLTGLQQEVGFGTTVEIKDAQIMGAGRAVAVKLRVESHGRVSAKATLLLNGVPRFNALTKELWLDELDYDLQTKHLPVKVAELFLHEGLRRRVSEAARYNLSRELNGYRSLANAEGKRYEAFPGIEFSGRLSKFDAAALQVQDNGVAVALVLSGKGRFVVHSLPL